MKEINPNFSQPVGAGLPDRLEISIYEKTVLLVLQKLSRICLSLEPNVKRKLEIIQSCYNMGKKFLPKKILRK